MRALDRLALARPALAILLLLALGGGGETLYLTVQAYRESRARLPDVPADRASRHEARLRPLRDRLPQRGVVGYTSYGLDENSFTSVEALEEFFLTQYALAPIIVVRSADLPTVVGIRDTTRQSGEIGGRPYPEDLELLADLGNGVVLLGRAER